MLRWKLFIPFTIALTAVALLGSYFWTASSSTRQLSALNNQAVASIVIEGNQLSITFENGQALAKVLEELDNDQIRTIFSDKIVKLQRRDVASLDASLANQIELIVAQAAATQEYYNASLDLNDLAGQWGFEATMILWEDRIVAEVGNSTHSYIAQSPLKGVVSP